MQAGYRAPKTVFWSADAVRPCGRRHGRDRKREMRLGSTGSETPRMHGNSVHGNQEVPAMRVALRKRRAGRGTQKGTPFGYVAGKSDHRVVPDEGPEQSPRGVRRVDQKRKRMAALSGDK